VIILLEDSATGRRTIAADQAGGVGSVDGQASLTKSAIRWRRSVTPLNCCRSRPELASATDGWRQIVHDNVKRANRIIGDVLDLARRDRVKPERFYLTPWLENFSQEFRRGLDDTPPSWQQTVEPADIVITFDPHQLRQVLWNLCANACQHGVRPGETPAITLTSGIEPGRGRPFLEVRDTGPGVAPENAEKLFEPFFTTRSKGTGLGLYLARELCEANRAHLQYLPIPEGGSCFRITFAPANPAMEMD
jgi:two-component system sensor histidine kinase PilS (NtrC family)